MEKADNTADIIQLLTLRCLLSLSGVRICEFLQSADVLEYKIDTWVMSTATDTTRYEVSIPLDY